MQDHFRLVEQRGIGRVESGERLSALHLRAAPRVKKNARMGIDRLSGLLAARAGSLHRPAQRRRVHLRHMTCLPRFHHCRRARLVKSNGIVKDARVTSLGRDHCKKDAERRAIG